MTDQNFNNFSAIFFYSKKKLCNFHEIQSFSNDLQWYLNFNDFSAAVGILSAHKNNDTFIYAT